MRKIVSKEIEAKNRRWRTAETKDLRIKYIDYKGDERTYIDDFLVEEKDLIEVKPKKLKSSLTVRLKAKAARKFCKEKGGHKVYLITGKTWKVGKFYESLGYRKSGELLNHYRHVDFVIYEKFI